MIILDSTTRSLQMKLTGAVTTNQLVFATSYVDTTGSATTPGSQNGASNNTTAVTIVGAPAGSTQRLVKNIVIQNADTSSATVTIIYNDNSTLRSIVIATLAVGDQLIYEDGHGWLTMDANGNLKTSGSGGGAVSSVSNSDGTLTISPTIGSVVASIATGGVGTSQLASNAVTNAKLAQMSANTVKANATSGSASPTDVALSSSQLLGMGSTGNIAAISLGTNLSMSGTTLNASGGASVAYSSIAGCLPSSITGTNTTAALTVGSGQAADSTNTAYITSAGYSWAVSNGNAINGYQGGTTLPNSSTIHFFVCSGGSGTGSFASTSLTPTLPAGYSTYYRRIFSLNTNGSGALIGGNAIETDGGALTFYLASPPTDVSTSTLGTSRTLFTLTVPSGIKVAALMRLNTGSNAETVVTSPDEADIAPSNSPPQIFDVDAVAGATAGIFASRTTNTSGQVGARATTTSVSFYIVTTGFKDFRRN